VSNAAPSTAGRRDPGADAGTAIGVLREEILERGLSAARARALADALETAGRLVEAIEALADANRLERSPALERRLVRLRKAAFAQLDRSLPPPPWPPPVPDDEPGAPEGPPSIAAADLTPGRLRSGILRHGCVIVRGLVPAPRVERLKRLIDGAFAAYDASVAGRVRPGAEVTYEPIDSFHDVPYVRDWQRTAGGVLAVDFPRPFYEFLETVRETRLDRTIAAHLGERPVLSAEKCILRRLDAKYWKARLSDWHQDGAFLGDGIRTVDAWFALSRCGWNAPGMDVVPRRLERVIRTGDSATHFGWTVSLEVIEKELPGVPIWRPEFEPGDVFLFDELCLHRTACDLGMPDTRYAIESWFFAPSVYPDGLSTPIVI
jgi:hypothetical protein